MGVFDDGSTTSSVVVSVVTSVATTSSDVEESLLETSVVASVGMGPAVIVGRGAGLGGE